MQRSPRAVPGSAAPFDATGATGGVVLLRQHGPPEREAWTDPRLAVPPLPPRLVSRPRLLDVLDAAVARAALTLVTSEPDGGKTVLLAEWARRRPDPAAWLALSRADNDPLRFWSLFLRAVGAPGSFPLPTAWSGRAVPGLLDSLFGRDRPAAAPAAVVLDDAHVLTERHVLDGLDCVISRWSARVRLVIASRSVPLLPIHRYRLAGQLAELGTGDLARTAEEAVELLRAHGVSLTGEELARLTARTEGWTGGLRLAALRMEGSHASSRLVTELAMDRGSIGEYLVEEVLSTQPQRVRRLLVDTSLLDVVSGESAEAITGIPGCEQILAELARTNSFVVPLDSSYTRFRYHQLFREVLHYLARRRDGRATRNTYRRATAWFRRNGDISRAVQCAAVTRPSPARCSCAAVWRKPSSPGRISRRSPTTNSWRPTPPLTGRPPK